MALIYADRVSQLSATTGVGTYTLTSTVAGCQNFGAIGDGNSCYYSVSDGSGWEVALGTYTSSGTTLTRTSILASSNSGSAVSWSAGNKVLQNVFPAAHDGLLVHKSDTETITGDKTFSGSATFNSTFLYQKDQNAISLLNFQNLMAVGNNSAAMQILVKAVDASGNFGSYPQGYTPQPIFAGRFVIGAGSNATGLTFSAPSAAHNMKFYTGGTTLRMYLDENGRLGLGISTTLTAILHLKAGTATASTAPLKFTSGSLLTTPEAGAVEYLTDKFYGTITGAARKTFAFLESPALVTPDIGAATGSSLNLTGNLECWALQVDSGTLGTSGSSLTITNTTRIMGDFNSDGWVKSTSLSSGIGYGAGAGAAVTQTSNRTTSVSVNSVCGTITTMNTSLAAGAEAIFTVNNSSVALRDVILLSVVSGPIANTSLFSVSRVSAGQFDIRCRNVHASVADTGAAIINFAVIKAVNA